MCYIIFSKQRKGRQRFTLVELLVVIAIIALLAGMLLPVLQRAKQKAQESACINNLKQIGTAIIIYRDNYNDEMPPWISSLYPEYLNTVDVYHCAADANPRDTDPQDWRPWLNRDGDGDDPPKWEDAFDRENKNNHGLHNMTRGNVEYISYFYEFTDAECAWASSGIELTGDHSWGEAKMVQMREGWKYDGDWKKRDSPWDPSLFPVLRCFWHIRGVNPSDEIIGKNAPVLNVSYAGNFFYTRVTWESGAWTP